ncbi:response regulator [Novosphingobium piscinae]|uniref:Response regulator transcription factor n=1 Tax=Novosphingobium piscinae TaxID=1507448 RepID=A0A7X1KRN7_9SPHN|nr:response regulator transcription factor [Novosphingobium piscinae]MBC2670768.1 response regulator transcription factor [Novosphingobium piscinae]
MTTVLIADDHAFIRTGVEAVLAPTGYAIIAHASSGREALAAVERYQPDICVFDVAMPDGDGVATLQQLRHAGDQRPVVLLTAQIDDRWLVDALDAGVNGIVAKAGGEDVLIATLDRVMAGEAVVGADLLERAREERARRAVPSPLAVLTPRERTIVALIARGQRNRDIAAALGITEGTIKVYLHALYQKLGVENRTELAVLALKHRDELA